MVSFAVKLRSGRIAPGSSSSPLVVCSKSPIIPILEFRANTLEAIADLNSAYDDGAVAPRQAAIVRCEVVTDFHRLEQLWPQWVRLWECDPRAEVFQSTEWARAWWHAFGSGYTLCTLVVFAGDDVEGILPLVRRGNRLQFLGTPEADYGDMICRQQRATEVLTLALKTLLESVHGWEECSFQHLSRNSRMVQHYRDLPRSLRAKLRCVPADRQQTIILRGQREAVFKSLLGKHHTRRLQNKLRKAGELSFRYLESEQEAQQYLPEFFRHHIRRHAALGRQSLCASPDFCQFIKTLIHELTPTGRVRFGVLELDGKPLAWDLGFQVNGKFLLYQHTFDLDTWHYTPGEVLLWNELKHAKDHVSREFDFGRGDELYKDRFANYTRETFSMFLVPFGVKGALRGWERTAQAFVQPAVGKAREIVKRQRSTLRAFRSLRMWMIGTLGCIRQAKKNGSLASCALRVTKQMFSELILSRKSTEVFTREAEALVASSPVPPEQQVSFSEAQLGDLVDLAREHPHILSLKDLAHCRKRMKNGDRVYVVRQQSQTVIVCWASGKEDAGEQAKAGLGADPNGPAVVIRESWSARDRDLAAPYRLLLTAVSSKAVRRNAVLFVHCGPNQGALRKELELQGFQRRFKTTRYKIFSHFRRKSVAQFPQNSLDSPRLG